MAANPGGYQEGHQSKELPFTSPAAPTPQNTTHQELERRIWQYQKEEQ
ncbi:uncharacterized protein EKO05_0002343 [Ascochyta rabiei]|nr:uncharacterized protein EKO05_0002343 [Ascochyta rabiei]UPX11753.1 hypothetical protein EKO05_0002343 [Ascochyta rabiei]